ncbi:MAG: hypothetical protein ACUVT2_10480 [Thiobacillaceae bacterium]
MYTPQPDDAGEIVIDATRWLMRRYRQTGCRRFARMIEQHLSWIREHATRLHLVETSCRLSLEWQVLACSRLPSASRSTADWRTAAMSEAAPSVTQQSDAHHRTNALPSWRPGETSVASLLVAALLMLHRPCPRNREIARLLLERAAVHEELTSDERIACSSLAEDLDSVIEPWHLPAPVHPLP